jgi:cation diffusion facilitator CzcD-associated flavoprotein CzcO
MPVPIVAVIGGGFCGTMVAAHLARRGVRTIIVERRARAGRDLAYTTPSDDLLLYAVGAWRAADLWESTAVPELRQQTAEVADRLSIEADTFPAPVRTLCSP